ncbi:MAG: hypothetical protein HYX40_03160 [Sphingobacteriales bacterium]|nr:hypothetical protein [Sphingobacteriales bacterium]
MKLIVIIGLLSIPFYSNAQSGHNLLTPKDFKAYLTKPDMDSLSLSDFLKCDSLSASPSFLTVKYFRIHIGEICVNGGPFYEEVDGNKLSRRLKDILKKKLSPYNLHYVHIVFDAIKGRFKNGNETSIEPFLIKVTR